MKKYTKRKFSRKLQKSKRGGVHTIKSSTSGRIFTISSPKSTKELSRIARDKLRKDAKLKLIIELDNLFTDIPSPGKSRNNPEFLKHLEQIDNALRRATASKLFTKELLKTGRESLHAETTGKNKRRYQKRALEAPGRLERGRFTLKNPTEEIEN